MDSSFQVTERALEIPALPCVGLLPLKVDIRPGTILERRGFRVGRQAQMMPVLHSMADHEAAPTLSSRHWEIGLVDIICT